MTFSGSSKNHHLVPCSPEGTGSTAKEKHMNTSSEGSDSRSPLAALASDLRDGHVIELSMPHDAFACLVVDARGKFCFVWETCYYGEDEKQACLSFDTLEELLFWVVSCQISQHMKRQEAQRRYNGAFDSATGSILAQFAASDANKQENQ